MKRAALALIGIIVASLASAPAYADCAEEVASARQALPKIKDESHRRELTLLLDKAAKDAAAGREKLCIDDMVRAQALMN